MIIMSIIELSEILALDICKDLAAEMKASIKLAAIRDLIVRYAAYLDQKQLAGGMSAVSIVPKQQAIARLTEIINQANKLARLILTEFGPSLASNKEIIIA